MFIDSTEVAWSFAVRSPQRPTPRPPAVPAQPVRAAACRPEAKTPSTPSLEHRAAVHHALGDVHRLAIVDAPRLSDRAPSELAALTGTASNLLAHHLDVLEAAGVVVSMGCGDACPVLPGKRYLDWELTDPAGKGVDHVRPIRDDIEARVRGLLGELGVSPQG